VKNSRLSEKLQLTVTLSPAHRDLQQEQRSVQQLSQCDARGLNVKTLQLGERPSVSIAQQLHGENCSSGGVSTSQTISPLNFLHIVSATPKVIGFYSVSATAYSVHVLPLSDRSVCYETVVVYYTNLHCFLHFTDTLMTQRRRPLVVTSSNCDVIFGCQAKRSRVSVSKPAARFTKYFTTVL